MPRINIRQLRDTRTLKEWLRAGLSVELTDRNKVIGRILPEYDMEPNSEPPDFAARQKRIFGKRKFPSAVDMLEDRSRF